MECLVQALFTLASYSYSLNLEATDVQGPAIYSSNIVIFEMFPSSFECKAIRVANLAIYYM